VSDQAAHSSLDAHRDYRGKEGKGGLVFLQLSREGEGKSRYPSPRASIGLKKEGEEEMDLHSLREGEREKCLASMNA